MLHYLLNQLQFLNSIKNEIEHNNWKNSYPRKFFVLTDFIISSSPYKNKLGNLLKKVSLFWYFTENSIVSKFRFFKRISTRDIDFCPKFHFQLIIFNNPRLEFRNHFMLIGELENYLANFEFLLVLR